MWDATGQNKSTQFQTCQETDPYVKLAVIRSWSVNSRKYVSYTDRIAPGSTVTSTAAIVFETVNVVESTTFTEPPLKVVGLTLENSNENGSGTVP